MKLAGLRSDNFRFLRLYGKVRPPRAIFSEPPERPIGVKLELTYSCNLRCAFCYTDSPRRTLQRSTDLADEAWLKIVDDAIDLGIVEAVVTGGEPLLRRELTLEVIERLGREGIGVAFNTNGWFVDEEVASRLARLPAVTVHLSVDGAAPHLHDGQRGVPGSWRRAIAGLDHLLDAGVSVCVVHVITPENESHFGEMLEQMWTLGVPWIRPTPVIVTGAAARGGDWSVSRSKLRKVVEDFERRRGTAMKIDLRPGTAGDLAHQGRRAPGSLLVRPNGAVRVDSLRPFSYGNASRDGLAECWAKIRDGWQDERIKEWTGSLDETSDIADSALVPYLDDEVAIGDPGRGADVEPDGVDGRSAPVPAPTPPRPVDPQTDLREAAEHIRGLALARNYRINPMRAGGGQERIVRRVADGGYLRLNRSAGVVMDALDGGTPAQAAIALRDRGAPDGVAEIDALRATRDLVANGVVAPAQSRESWAPRQDPGPSDLPGLEPTGGDV